MTNITEKLLSAKRKKDITFAHIGEGLNRNEVWIAALFYRQATATKEEVAKLAKVLDLSTSELEELSICPLKGGLPTVPTDPLIYRFYEIMQVYGDPIKAIIHEKFGDGIMSAIDFTLSVDKENDPKGDRVKITMNGKFLPYKKW